MLFKDPYMTFLLSKTYLYAKMVWMRYKMQVYYTDFESATVLKIICILVYIINFRQFLN